LALQRAQIRASPEADSSQLPVIRIKFSADVHQDLTWKFTPLQPELKVTPGEPALAFYQVENYGDKTLVGVSTYNVTPMKSGVYFNKLQCFCFEEQKLRPKESIELPVFFFIDPDHLTDPNMKGVRDVTLCYTFFKSKDQDDGDQSA